MWSWGCHCHCSSSRWPRGQREAERHWIVNPVSCIIVASCFHSSWKCSIRKTNWDGSNTLVNSCEVDHTIRILSISVNFFHSPNNSIHILPAFRQACGWPRSRSRRPFFPLPAIHYPWIHQCLVKFCYHPDWFIEWISPSTGHIPVSCFNIGRSSPSSLWGMLHWTIGPVQDEPFLSSWRSLVLHRTCEPWFLEGHWSSSLNCSICNWWNINPAESTVFLNHKQSSTRPSLDPKPRLCPLARYFQRPPVRWQLLPRRTGRALPTHPGLGAWRKFQRNPWVDFPHHGSDTTSPWHGKL